MKIPNVLLFFHLFCEHTHRILIEMIKDKNALLFQVAEPGTVFVYIQNPIQPVPHFRSRAVVATPPTRDGVFCVKIARPRRR